MKKIFILLTSFILIIGICFADEGNPSTVTIKRTAVIVSDKSSVTVTLNRDFSDYGITSDYLVNEDAVYSPSGEVTIQTGSVYKENFTITTYSGATIEGSVGDYFDEIVLGNSYDVEYDVYVVDFSIIYNGINLTDNDKVGAVYDSGGGFLRVNSNITSITNSIKATDFKWYYHSKPLSTGIMKSVPFYTGKNVFSLELSNSEYKKAILEVDGIGFNGTSKSTHYMVLDNPYNYTVTDTGNYNFEIVYDSGYLVKESFEKQVNGTNIVSVSNREFLVHKPNFSLSLKFIDRTKILGENLNEINYSWNVLSGNGSISGESYTNSDGIFSANITQIQLNVASDGISLTPVTLSIHPFKPVMNFNSSIDMKENETLRITNIRDLRWQDINDTEYLISNMKNYKNTGTVLDLPDSVLGTNKNPKMGYGVFFALNTINEYLGKADSITVAVLPEDEPRDMLKGGTILSDIFKNIVISRGASGVQKDFIQKQEDGINKSIWRFMYYLPGKKDNTVGDEVKVYFDDIIISYPNGNVKYSDWFNKKIHVFTYDNRQDTIDDIENYLVY